MEIKYFKNLFGTLTVIVDNSELWFVGNEVATLLGYENPTKAFTDHIFNKNDRKALKLKASNESLKAILWTKKNDFSDKTIISEAGLYALIFGSKMPNAIDFQDWVTHTVLPSIRKNGGYIAGQENLSSAQLEKLIQKVNKLSERISSQKADIKRLQKRRHELIAENKKNYQQRIKFKKELSAQKDCTILYEKMLFNEMKENDNLREKIQELTSPKPVIQKRTSGPKLIQTVRVDANGFVI